MQHLREAPSPLVNVVRGARAQTERLANNSKPTQVIAMLRREGGTTVGEIMAAIYWQKQTIRSILSAGGPLTKNQYRERKCR